MAKQHFYSRVPARGSLYNRSDGFDTFAQSEGLTREFVERELSAVYENKLGKQDAEAVRTGKMPIVYSQSCLRSGELVQSCVSYLPKDYTGERSAYLCHSLILSEEEKQLVFESKENSLLNSKMFVSDAGVFDFTAQSADAQYPQKPYVPCRADDPKDLVSCYDANTIKSFLFALLNVLCMKGKTVYFKMPCADEQVSDEALRFINAIASVIPYHLRKNISFVTYVTDPTQYAHIKIKCVSADCPEKLLTKGIFVDLGTNLVTGMPAGDAVAKMPVNFFFSLLEDTTIRNEFLLFMDRAVKMVSGLEKLNAKILSDLVFLFGGASSLYDQDKVLPTDDDVYAFLSSYEKYRGALGEESRRNAFKCLERYPRRHTAIPKNIFAKLPRMYEAEETSVKRIVMNVVLELIHTDVMRDKLFTFLKNNYDEETADVQNMINADLCRVYYGGFLQTQILDFFQKHFAAEPEETQDMIFDKLMLTIRTASVQNKIVAFVAEHYGVFTDGQKQRLYETIYEMLPEYDSLSAALVGLLNAQMPLEDAERREYVAKMLSALLAADYKKSEHKLMPMLCAEPGFCRDIVAELALGPWHTRKIFEEYIGYLSAQPILEKTAQIAKVLELSAAEKKEELLALSAQRIYEGDEEKADLYLWLEADALVRTEVARHSGALGAELCTKITQPAITRRLKDVLNRKLRKDGLQQITQYAKDNAFLQSCKAYKTLATLRQLTEAVEAVNTVNAYRQLASLLQENGDNDLMAAYLADSSLNWETQTPEQAMLCQSCCNILKEQSFFSEDVYALCRSRYAQILATEDPKLTGTRLVAASADRTAELLVRHLVIAGKEDDILLQIIHRDEAGMDAFLRAFCGDYGRGAEKCILPKVENAPVQLREMISGLLETAKAQKTSFFAKLFGKK